MTRLYCMPDPATKLVADLDGEDAPMLAVGARHGHPPGMRVRAVDFGARTYVIETVDGFNRETRAIPARWFDLDDDTEAPALVIHDSDAVTRVPFVPETVDPLPAARVVRS